MKYEISLLLILASLTLFISICSGKSFPRQQDIAIVKINNGQTYTCVDFYKQPAFINSSLNLKAIPNMAKLQQQKSASEFGLKGLGCPVGTVPILDHSKLKASEFDVVEPRPLARSNLIEQCSARVQTKANNPNKKFFGANAFIDIYKPYVQASQWSSARIKLLNGVDSIEAGWMVNPSEFKNDEAHLYASFNVGGKRCINLDCPGFVQVSTDIPLGISPSSYSEYDGKQIGWKLSIDKHQDDGNWWLSIKEEKHQIGYWPKNLFTTLADVANQVEFGGETYNPGEKNVPSMGNGHKAAYDTKLSSCFRQATVVDESLKNVDLSDTEKFLNCNLLYTVLDGGKQGDPSFGRLIFYGGPL